MKLPAPNRIAVYVAGLASLLAAIAPIVADLDLTSTVGVVAGLAALVTVVSKWLTGWQQHEAVEAHIEIAEAHAPIYVDADVPDLPVE